MSLLLQRGRLRKLIGALAVLAMLGGIWASNTRSPYFVATVSVSVFIFLVYFSKLTLARVQVAVLALPALIVVFMANENFYSSLIQGRTKVEMGSSAVRDSMLQTGLAVAQGSPILGFGDGRSPFKAGMVGMNGVLTIDNGYLSWVLDFGYVGFTLFFLVAGLAMLVGVRSTSDKRPPGDNLLLKCAVSYIAGALVGLYVISIYDNLIVGSLLIGAIYSARKWGVNGRRGKAPAQRRPYISMHSSRPRHSLG
jgi:O-antigen ligase